MPELPEVETVCRMLKEAHPSLVGATITGLTVLRPSVVGGEDAAQSFHDTVVGKRFSEIFRHGKYLFFRLYDPRETQPCWMALHLRMTGRLWMVPATAECTAYTRSIFYLSTGFALRFDDPRAFGRTWLVSHPSEVTHNLGPDALTVSESLFLKRLACHRRQLKPLLLDQTFLAGLGNIYCDESLFRAGLHPLRSAADLTDGEQRRLYRSIQTVLHDAVACKGANIDGVFEAGLFPVAVYGRQGLPCPVCGTMLQKLRVSQRGTHLCPTCQPFVN